MKRRVRTANVGLCSSQENLKPSSFSSTNVQVLPVMFRTEESLKERREKMALNFAKKSLRLDKFSELFPFNNAKHLMKKRNHDTCPPNRNDVFRIGQRVRPLFLNSVHLIGSGDMCPQIKSIYFLVLLAKNG